MPTPVAEPANGGLPGAARQVAEHASSLARLELELAGLELKKKVAALGGGLALGGAAAVLGLFGLGFLFATVAAAFETFLATWLALLVTAGILFAAAGLFGLTALALLRHAAPPLPEQAIAEARLTSEALKR
jgi:hypothetical protein